MAFNSQLLNFYRTDSNTVFNIVFASLFDIIISKQLAYLSNKTKRKKFLKKDGLLWFSADLPLWITRTKCMQNKNGLKICRIALQRIALLSLQKSQSESVWYKRFQAMLEFRGTNVVTSSSIS